MGVEDEWGPVLLVRTGADKDGGMSVSLRTGMRKDNICYKQSAWELTKSDVRSCRRTRESRCTQVCCCFSITLKYVQLAFT